MLKVLLFLAVIAAIVVLFLRPNPSSITPIEPRGGLSGFEARLMTAWATHSNVWKRWIVFLAGIGVGLVAPWALSGFAW